MDYPSSESRHVRLHIIWWQSVSVQCIVYEYNVNFYNLHNFGNPHSRWILCNPPDIGYSDWRNYDGKIFFKKTTKKKTNNYRNYFNVWHNQHLNCEYKI